MEYSQKSLGLRIARYRNINNLTQKELAQKCELSQSYIAEIENGNGEYIGMQNLSSIADVLNVSIDELLIDSLIKYSDLQNKPELSTIRELLATFTEEQLRHYIKLVKTFKEYKEADK